MKYFFYLNRTNIFLRVKRHIVLLCFLLICFYFLFNTKICITGYIIWKCPTIVSYSKFDYILVNNGPVKTFNFIFLVTLIQIVQCYVITNKNMFVLKKSVTIYFIIMNLSYYVKCALNSPSFFNSFITKFDQCVAKVQGTTSNLVSCFGHPALDSLQEIDNTENFTLVEGIKLVKMDGLSSRNINWLDQDPTDFRYLKDQ